MLGGAVLQKLLLHTCCSKESMSAGLPQYRYRTSTYPFISPTFQSHQLWTPFYLQRITIDNPNYHTFLSRSITTNPPHLNALSRRVQRYGDNGFFQQKDIPVEQKYDVTSLQRSSIRPWDQIVSRPIVTPLVMSKESDLPFPAEHPFTSHISQFSVFPNTCKTNTGLHLREPTPLVIGTTAGIDETEMTDVQVQTKAVGTQTDDGEMEDEGNSKKQKAYLISDKSYCHAARKEIHNVGLSVSCKDNSNLLASLRPGIYRWDVSRSLSPGHQRSMTYPAPTTMYSPNNHPVSFRSLPLSPGTRQALESVNHRISTSTTYEREFSSPRPVPKPTLSTFNKQMSASSSRGKYARAPVFHQLYSEDSSIPSRPQSGSTLYTRKLSLPDGHLRDANDANVNTTDKATQTDFEEGNPEEKEGVNDEMESIKITQFQLPVRPESEDGGYLRPSTAGSYSTSGQTCSDHPSTDSVLKVPYNRTEALQRFNTVHYERAPDIRENSIRSGRRHIINGYHAYYWH